jgi:hypothetical protein
MAHNCRMATHFVAPGRIRLAQRGSGADAVRFRATVAEQILAALNNWSSIAPVNRCVRG